MNETAVHQANMGRFLYFIVFVSGMSTLVIEMSASRLLGSAFGTSNLVWASIIGLILIYLTVGYFWGGRLADRFPNYQTMFKFLAWGAFSAGLLPLIARPVLSMAADAFDQLQLGVLFGSFTAVLVLFAVPVTLLGMTSPFAIRLAVSDAQQAGQISGRIYAVSTLGSFVGTFLPELVLIPSIGTTYTFISCAIFLLLVTLAGIWLCDGWRSTLRWSWMPLALLLLGLLFGSRQIKNTVGQIFEKESSYNYIQVLEVDGYRMLRLNEGQGVHSIWHPTELDYQGPWEQFLAAPFFNTPDYAPEQIDRIAIVGLAAGTLARQATAVFGLVPIDGYEIDPAIIETGQRFFDMNETNLNAIAQDGRWGLEHSQQRYTIIGVDAYRPPYIPWELTTREFFRVVHERLNDDGAAVINVGRAPNDRRLLDGLVATLRTEFPSVYVMDLPDTFNSVIYATAQPTNVSNFYKNLLYLYTRDDIHPLLIEAMRRFVINQKPLAETGIVFTDDKAPIEWLTNQMVLNYVFFEDMEALR